MRQQEIVDAGLRCISEGAPGADVYLLVSEALGSSNILVGMKALEDEERRKQLIKEREL